VYNSQDTRTNIIILVDLEIVMKILGVGAFLFDVLTAVGIQITVMWDIAPCSSLERLHVSKQSYIFIFVFIISIYGDI